MSESGTEQEAQPSSPVAVNEGAEDVVEADVAASEAHTAHLVEGDFFPAEVPVVEVESGGNDADEANVDQIAAEAAAAVAAASVASTPPKVAAPASRKRVCWVDDAQGSAAAAHGLVKHVTSFYMPHSARGSRLDAADASSPTRPSHAAAVNPAPSVFREKLNADGSTYKISKAQRPALRFGQWRRHQHEYGQTPFEPQPVEAAGYPAAAAPTLFGQLYARSSVTRVAEGHVRTRPGTHLSRSTDSMQMPLLRDGEFFDQPLVIPLPAPS